MSNNEFLLEAELSPEEVRRVFLSAENLSKVTISSAVDAMIRQLPEREKDIRYIERHYAKDPGEVTRILSAINSQISKNGSNDAALKTIDTIVNRLRGAYEEQIDLSNIADDMLCENPVDRLLMRNARNSAKTSAHIAKSGGFLPSKFGKHSADTFEDLANAWQRQGRPLESKYIIKMLKKRGYTNKNIKQIFTNANVPLVPQTNTGMGRGLFKTKSSGNRNEIVIHASEIIMKHGIRKLVLKHLRDDYKIDVTIKDISGPEDEKINSSNRSQHTAGTITRARNQSRAGGKAQTKSKAAL